MTSPSELDIPELIISTNGNGIIRTWINGNSSWDGDGLPRYETGPNTHAHVGGSINILGIPDSAPDLQYIPSIVHGGSTHPHRFYSIEPEPNSFLIYVYTNKLTSKIYENLSVYVTWIFVSVDNAPFRLISQSSTSIRPINPVGVNELLQSWYNDNLPPSGIFEILEGAVQEGLNWFKGIFEIENTADSYVLTGEETLDEEHKTGATAEIQKLDDNGNPVGDPLEIEATGDNLDTFTVSKDDLPLGTDTITTIITDFSSGLRTFSDSLKWTAGVLTTELSYDNIEDKNIQNFSSSFDNSKTLYVKSPIPKYYQGWEIPDPNDEL